MSVLEQEVPTKDLLDSSRGALPRVNLLPPEILVRRRVRRVQHGLGGGGLLVLALLAFVYVGAVGSAHDADAELREVTATGQAAQAERAGYADVAAVYARAEAAETMLATAMGEEVRYSTHLEQLARTVPDRLWLDNVAFSQTPTEPVAGDDHRWHRQRQLHRRRLRPRRRRHLARDAGGARGLRQAGADQLHRGAARRARHGRLRDERRPDPRRALAPLRRSGRTLTWTASRTRSRWRSWPCSSCRPGPGSC
jgi:hypothetical protein